MLHCMIFFHRIAFHRFNCTMYIHMGDEFAGFYQSIPLFLIHRIDNVIVSKENFKEVEILLTESFHIQMHILPIGMLVICSDISSRNGLLVQANIFKARNDNQFCINIRIFIIQFIILTTLQKYTNNLFFWKVLQSLIIMFHNSIHNETASNFFITYHGHRKYLLFQSSLSARYNFSSKVYPQ